MTAGKDPYKILQVDSEAEDEVIQAAYRRLAQKYHPDVATEPDAAARMTAINAAWAVLGDPARRAAHDRERRLAELGAAAATAAAGAASHGPPAPGRAGSGPPRPATPTGSPTARPGSQARHEPDPVSSDWTSGRSSHGGGYDPSRMRAPEGLGAAGAPPGNPAGAILNFGRYAGWSLGEIGRSDLEYIEWLDRMPIGRPYRDEIDAILRRSGRRVSAATAATARHGLFRRR
jgi:curved DNA-binding protein CbpA